jgi:putative DNA methylase
MLGSDIAELSPEDNVAVVGKAIEDGFPIGPISLLAERESWRKEVYRPIYYMHKWWARRLGSVFRAIILASHLDAGKNVGELFYQWADFKDITIFDPFMGSGTTIGEAVKLGCRAIGRDINPVSVAIVATMLEEYSRPSVKREYQRLQHAVAPKIQAFYKAKLSSGELVDVLYYFWVKIVPCPLCGESVELFKNRIFSKHAYPKKYPEAKSICPNCKAINDVIYNSKEAKCAECAFAYNPQLGNVKGPRARCPNCQAEFKIINVMRRSDSPPAHQLYAKMVLTNLGEKVYLPADAFDNHLYLKAAAQLEKLQEYIPQGAIQAGYNTNQVLNYNYTHWHQMFNARQLTCIALLASAICSITEPSVKNLFALLFSGVLEFNNMFCSFKGEGTGAVRHMFSHHILKPELTPIEANLWGTPKSSGSFSTLFKSRILNALDYKEAPFELKLVEANGKLHSKKIFRINHKVNRPIARSYADFAGGEAVYLSCGDSANTDIPDKSVDYVITDPPFFDNVHYSQLADFFYVWLRQILGENDYFQSATTRTAKEVQDTDSQAFTDKLRAVFTECHRVLKDDGLMVFTYHHSRAEGWASVYEAVRKAGFQITHTQPIKAEMAVSVSIKQANEPVNFDLIIVCRKFQGLNSQIDHDSVSLLAGGGEAKSIVNQLSQASVKVSLGDVKVILMGCILARLSVINNLNEEIEMIYKFEQEADNLLNELGLEFK